MGKRNHGSNELHECAWNGEEKKLEALLEKEKADAKGDEKKFARSFMNNHKRTPLHFAAFHAEYACAETCVKIAPVMMKMSTNVGGDGAQKQGGFTPLHEVCTAWQSGNESSREKLLKIANLLLVGGADPKAVCFSRGSDYTVLRYAKKCKGGSNELYKLIRSMTEPRLAVDDDQVDAGERGDRRELKVDEADADVDAEAKDKKNVKPGIPKPGPAHEMDHAALMDWLNANATGDCFSGVRAAAREWVLTGEEVFAGKLLSPKNLAREKSRVYVNDPVARELLVSRIKRAAQWRQ